MIHFEDAKPSVIDNKTPENRQPFRLVFHISPPANWMNDPNGLCYFNGEYHVFYQYYPFGTSQAEMYWGHVSSPDMISWYHQPIALTPDPVTDVSCFSGSAVIDGTELCLLYTSHDSNRVPKEMQFLATSADGIHFWKDPSNPVISHPPSDAGYDFRDPKVWQHQGLWYMVLGSSADGQAQALIYRSQDLRNWQELGIAMRSDGTLGSMWECPDIYPLADRHIFACSPMESPLHKNVLVIGEMDYDTGRFAAESYQEADYGEDFYAMQSFETPDGRRVMIAWMEKWRQSYITAQEGWVGAMTILREMSFENGQIKIRPIREMAELRQQLIVQGDLLILPGLTDYLAAVQGMSLEIMATLDFSDVNCLQGGLKLRMSQDRKQQTRVYYDRLQQAVICDRTDSGLGSNVETKAPIKLGQNQQITLRIFIDHSSIEIFINDGEAVITNRIYPDAVSQGYDFYAVEGKVHVLDYTVYTLKSIWPETVD